MITWLYQTQKESFQQIYKELSLFGKKVSPRGELVLEIENYSYELPPFYRFINFTDRKLSIPYIKKELLWYLNGDLFDLSIADVAPKIWSRIIHKGKLNSNYGYHFFRNEGLNWVVEELVRDKDSRRACVTILNNSVLNREELDVPCTGYLNFRIRDNKLNVSVHMRSQDAIYGMGNDLPAFSFVQEIVYRYLLNKYPALEMGTYYHTADSFHIYHWHFDMLEKLIDPKAEFTEVSCPPITERESVIMLSHGKLESDNGDFSKWLLQ
jgi:thymidylate synthase